MVLNHDQRLYAKLYLRDFLCTFPSIDRERIEEILESLFMKHRMRMDIYYDLKGILEKEFPDIDKKIFYGIILKEIHDLMRSGLDHLDVFVPTDLDYPDIVKSNINRKI